MEDNHTPGQTPKNRLNEKSTKNLGKMKTQREMHPTGNVELITDPTLLQGADEQLAPLTQIAHNCLENDEDDDTESPTDEPMPSGDEPGSCGIQTSKVETESMHSTGPPESGIDVMGHDDSDTSSRTTGIQTFKVEPESMESTGPPERGIDVMGHDGSNKSSTSGTQTSKVETESMNFTTPLEIDVMNPGGSNTSSSTSDIGLQTSKVEMESTHPPESGVDFLGIDGSDTSSSSSAKNSISGSLRSFITKLVKRHLSPNTNEPSQSRRRTSSSTENNSSDKSENDRSRFRSDTANSEFSTDNVEFEKSSYSKSPKVLGKTIVPDGSQRSGSTLERNEQNRRTIAASETGETNLSGSNTMMKSGSKSGSHLPPESGNSHTADTSIVETSIITHVHAFFDTPGQRTTNLPHGRADKQTPGQSARILHNESADNHTPSQSTRIFPHEMEDNHTPGQTPGKLSGMKKTRLNKKLNAKRKREMYPSGNVALITNPTLLPVADKQVAPLTHKLSGDLPPKKMALVTDPKLLQGADQQLVPLTHELPGGRLAPKKVAVITDPTLLQGADKQVAPLSHELSGGGLAPKKVAVNSDPTLQQGADKQVVPLSHKLSGGLPPKKVAVITDPTLLQGADKQIAPLTCELQGGGLPPKKVAFFADLKSLDLNGNPLLHPSEEFCHQMPLIHQLVCIIFDTII